MWKCWIAVACAACGRIGFDPEPGDRSRYQLTIARSGFDAAGAACAAGGRHLATVDGPQENALLATFAAMIPIDAADTPTTNHQSLMWLGGRSVGDGSLRANWKWETGEPMAYENWRAMEPDNADERCLIMLGRENGLWDNRACNEMFGFLCETD